MKGVKKYDYKPLPLDHSRDPRVYSTLKKFYLDLAGMVSVAEWEPVFKAVKRNTSTGLCDTKDKQDHIRTSLVSILAFWRYGHLFNYRCLWKGSSKEEILPLAKIEDNDLRLFLIPPADQYFSHARLAHNFDEAVLETFGTGPRPFGYGVSIHTLREHLSPLLKFDVVGYSDAKRYDATVGHMEFVNDVVELRKFCHDKNSMPVAEFEERIRYCMDECSVNYLLTPDGQMFEKVGGAPSGKKSTTMDNTIIHLKRWIQVIRARLDCCLFDLMLSGEIWLSLFGDDVVFGMTRAMYDALGWRDYSVYQADFLRAGMIVKPEMYIGPNISELSYLGMKLGRDDYGITLTFPPNKILAAILHPKRKFNTDEIVQLLNSLTLLCPFDRPMFEMLVSEIIKTGATPQYSFDGVRFMWLGLEAGEALRDSKSSCPFGLNLSDPVECAPLLFSLKELDVHDVFETTKDRATEEWHQECTRLSPGWSR